MPDLTDKQGRSHDASIVIEKLESKPVSEAKAELIQLQPGQVKDVRDLVDQLLAPGNEDDRQKYGAIKDAANVVLEQIESLPRDEDIDTALESLELTEKKVAEAVPQAKEALELKDKHEKLRKEQVTAWLDKYGQEELEKGLMTVLGLEGKSVNEDLLARFIHELKADPESLKVTGSHAETELRGIAREAVSNSKIKWDDVDLDSLVEILIDAIRTDRPIKPTDIAA